jgi:hypothetical protein
MTTDVIDYNTKRKLKLLQEMLAIVMAPKEIKNLVLEGGKEASFDIEILYQPRLGKRFVIRWDGNLNFKIYECGLTYEKFPFDVPTSRWYRVGRLLEARHLDGEALKQS